MKENSSKKSRIIICILCVQLIMSVTVFGFVGAKNPEYRIRLMQKGFRNLSQVNVYAGIRNGRGVIIEVNDDYMDILTSKHLVSEENRVSVEFGNKGRTDAEVIYYYVEADAAIIRVARSDFEQDLREAKAVKILSQKGYEALPLSKKVYYAKDIYDTTLEVSEGKWLSDEKFVYELGGNVGLFAGEVSPGMSGEGLFDENDFLIGMIVAANDTEGAVIPAYVLYGEYKSATLNQ